MTNTLHRQGTLESLKNDYVIFAHTAKDQGLWLSLRISIPFRRLWRN